MEHTFTGGTAASDMVSVRRLSIILVFRCSSDFSVATPGLEAWKERLCGKMHSCLDTGMYPGDPKKQLLTLGCMIVHDCAYDRARWCTILHDCALGASSPFSCPFRKARAWRVKGLHRRPTL